MPPLVIAAAIAAGGAVAGGAINARAAGRAAREQTQGANYAADRELEASREAERFARQQAQAQWADAEATRRANYDQWVARQRSINDFRRRYGHAEMTAPAYVPSQDPRYQDATAAAPPAAYQGPTPESWRTAQPRTRRPAPMGDVGSYLTRLRAPSPYRPPPMGDVGSYADMRRRR